jgi:hypothetical protein
MQVTVTNIKSGKVSNGLSFRYGVTMFISSFTPMEGPADTATTVTIFGQGFVAPVSVEIAGMSVPQWDVLSVSGTEIVSRSKPIPESARTCGDASGAITVINIGSNTKATSTQSFTYRAIRPLITSVQIDSGTNTVQQYVPVAVPPSVAVCSTPWGNHRVTIRGSGFQQGMMVSFGCTPEVPATFVDATTLTLAKLPDLTCQGLNQVDCVPPTGGKRNTSTPVSLTVHNLTNDCRDTLNGAIVIVPCDQTCLAVPPTPTPTPTPTPVIRTLTLTRTLNAPGDGTITANPGSFVCPTTCAPTFADGVNVSLTATVTTGTFGGWTGDCLPCGTAVSCSVLMNANRACTATFNP